MNNSHKLNSVNTLIGLVAGLLFGAVASYGLLAAKSTPTDQSVPAGNQPLYWVAPMDPNYRRDAPGLSPMGMELIPVYANNSAAASDQPGIVKIAPEVVNNLGVRTEFVSQIPLRSSIVTVGYVKYNEERLQHIHPRVAGWIEQLYVKAEGDPVAVGDPLYAIYSPQLVTAQEEYLLALDSGKSQFIAAAEQRLAALQLDKGFIKALKKQRQVQHTVPVSSRYTGVVDQLAIRQGFYVKPETTLLSIGNLEQVWVEAEIFERQVYAVQPGQKVSMTLDYLPGKVWHGEVDYIYPALDLKNRTLRLRVRFDNPDQVLKPNMFARLQVHAAPQLPELSVPVSALIRVAGQQRVVLALGDGRFKSVAVTTGRQDGERIEILSGLQLGDQIVVSAQFLLDSESSKTSDFRRMTRPGEHGVAATSVEYAEVAGEIRALRDNYIDIHHAPIAKWNRPAMTMTFLLSEDLRQTPLRVADSVFFRFEVHQGEFVITALEVLQTQQGKPSKPGAMQESLP